MLLDSTISVKNSFDLIESNSPEYVIISRLLNNEHLHYVFLTKLLTDYFQKFRDNKEIKNQNLQQFLGLHETDRDHLYSPNFPLKIEESYLTDKINLPISKDSPTILVENGTISKILDPIKGSVEGQYVIKRVGHTLKASSLQEGSSGLKQKIGVKIFQSLRKPDKKNGDQEHESLSKEDKVTGFISKGRPSLTLRKSMDIKKGLSSGSSPTTTFVRRYPVGTLEDHLLLKKLAVFEIKLKETAPMSSTISGMDVPLDQEITIVANTIPSGFVDFPDGNVKKMKILAGDSNPVIFEIMPIKVGDCLVQAKFFYQGNYLGDVGVKTKITSELTSSSSIEESSSIEIDIKNNGADLTLLILEENSMLNYKILGLSQTLGIPFKNFTSIKLKGDPERYFRTIFEDLENSSDNATINEDNASAKGKILYSELFPDDLKSFYWQYKDRIKSIQIFSQEPWIPWEIIKPWKDNDGDPIEEDFFCAKYAFTRWMDGIKVKNKKIINNIKVVVPKDTNLRGATAEFNWVSKFGAGINVNITRDSSYEDVTKSLKEGGFDLLLFTTHGSYEKESAYMSKVYLENDEVLKAEQISGIFTRFGRENPLVILNACQTGSQGFALTGIGGWAKAFLQAGSFGFIGTLWSIGDATALNFTKNLFNKLRQDMPLDQAVKEARLDARQSGDTSWLSYSLYAPSNSPIRIGND